MPDRLHFTGNDEADVLLATEPLALLIGFALDQQVTVPTAFSGPLKLKQRLGTLDAKAIAQTDPARLEEVFREKPAIHRFPGSMAARVQELAATIVDDYGGAAERVWTEATAGNRQFARNFRNRNRPRCAAAIQSDSGASCSDRHLLRLQRQSPHL